MPKTRLVEVGSAPSEELLLGNLQQGRFFLATVAMQEDRHEDAIGLFEKVSSPDAAFFQAQVPPTVAHRYVLVSCLPSLYVCWPQLARLLWRNTCMFAQRRQCVCVWSSDVRAAGGRRPAERRD